MFTETQRPATQSEILSGIADLLRLEFSEMAEDAIYWKETADPEASNNLDLFIQVHAGAGQFDQSILNASAIAVESTVVGVTIWNRSALDSVGRSEESLFGATSLLAMKRRILKALTGKMLYDEAVQIATETIKPIEAMEPRTGDASQPLDSLGLMFTVSFEWDLS